MLLLGRLQISRNDVSVRRSITDISVIEVMLWSSPFRTVPENVRIRIQHCNVPSCRSRIYPASLLMEYNG